MAILILIAFMVFRGIYLRKRKKSEQTTVTKADKFLEIGQFIVVMIVSCCVIGWIPNASVNKTYAEKQDEVNTIQAEIVQLEESFLKEDNIGENLEAFTTEYMGLKNELEEAELYINENKGFVERGLPTIKFLLYFGR